MHDAAEAFIGDVAKPLKVLLPDYAIIERRVEAAIAAQFGFSAEINPAVKAADIQMLRLEQASLFDNHDNWEWTFGSEPPDGVQVRGQLPDEAMSSFLARAEELRPVLFK